MFQPILKTFAVLEKTIQVPYFMLCQSLDIFVPWALYPPSSTHYKNGRYRFSRKLLKLATHKFPQAKTGRYSHWLEMTSSATSGRQANRTNLFILGHVRLGSHFLDNSADFENVHSFIKDDSSDLLCAVLSLDINVP